MNLLPKELDYLEPVAQELAKLPPEELTERVDVITGLEAALRARVDGLKLRDAVSRLTGDHEILKRWLEETKATDGAVFWIAGFLMRPGPLARSLLAPPPPPEPTVAIEPPAGWQKQSFPRRLDIRKGKLGCSILILDEAGFTRRQHKNDHREELQKSPKNPWAGLGVWSKSSVKFGECRGEKHLYVQHGKTNWKSVDYLLDVPGGFVNVYLGHEKGMDFDESEIEARLHTLKVIPPAAASSVATG